MTKKIKPFRMGYMDETGEQFESPKTLYTADGCSDSEFNSILEIGLDTAKQFNSMLILSEKPIG